MKCQACGDEKGQECLGPVDGQPEQVGYRCGACGRLYHVQVVSLDALLERLERVRAKSALLIAEQEKLATQLAEIEAQIHAVRDR